MKLMRQNCLENSIEKSDQNSVTEYIALLHSFRNKLQAYSHTQAIIGLLVTRTDRASAA